MALGSVWSDEQGAGRTFRKTQGCYRHRCVERDRPRNGQEAHRKGLSRGCELPEDYIILCYFNSLDDTVAYVSKDQYLPAMIQDVSEGIPDIIRSLQIIAVGNCHGSVPG